MNIRSLFRPFYCSRVIEVLVAALAVRVTFRRIRSLGVKNTSVAVLFPTDRGSVGDEAMVVALATQLREQGCTRLGLISFSPTDNWSDLAVFDEVRCRPTGWPLRWFGFCRWLSCYDALGVIGADVLDGYYSPSRSRARIFLAQIAHRLGLRTVLLGFSYRAHPERSSLGILQRCGNGIEVLCRDPRSLERVKNLAGILATQVADLAFLLNPSSNSQRVEHLRRWISGRTSPEGRVIGVNCNRQASANWKPAEADALIDAYVRAIASVGAAHPNVVFVLVPHDSRGEYSDEKLARCIHGRLNAELRERSYLIPDVWTAGEIKAAAELLDIAITGRMHFAIACLGSGTPVASFEYQDKFSGLYELFGLPELCVPGAQSGQSETVEALLEDMHRRVDALKAHVRAKLPEIRQLSMRNIRALLGESVE